jgi:hypothetical protein
MQTQVIYPALNKMGMWSEAAGELVLGTAIVESNLTYLKQHGDGPALGLWQVEPATHEDFYAFRPEMMNCLMGLRSPALDINENFATILMYGIAVCGLCYYRKSDPLPEAGDVGTVRASWNKHCNTPLGVGTVVMALGVNQICGCWWLMTF